MSETQLKDAKNYDFSSYYPQIDEKISRDSHQEDPLMTVLQEVQKLLGHLPPMIVSYISCRMSLPIEKIYSVIAGYPFFSLTPRGDHLITVCLGPDCFSQGANEVLDRIGRELEIRVGETTEDRKFTLLAGTCCESCRKAPVIMVDNDVYQGVRVSKIKEILDSYR
ncbi:MAG: NAD(P)H-dependent oxidoreductase subunit E [Spirochaetales bacterium]|nr:NAD(P)H-dependent oxidoreductase subunit E [Spirochaetales bacterium]